jgi:hypothetical protein|tara:strand:- start:4227 stop:4841 length:615 start_codon:yes stop_codon:yes gene_type:complete
MANSNVAFGLKPINTAGSTPATQGTNAYFIASDAAAIYQGSPVKCVNGGGIAIGSASGDTVALVGVFAGCEYVSSVTGKKVFSNTWPGTGADTNFDIIGHVYDNPMQRFLICTDASFTNVATARAAIFENALLSSGASGSATSGNSSAAMDIDGLSSADTSAPLKIVGIQTDAENEDYAAAGLPVIVMINNHALLQADSEAATS